MRNNITVYVIKSAVPDAADMNISYVTALQLRSMGIIEPDNENSEIVREGDTTVTVYAYRKAK